MKVGGLKKAKEVGGDLILTVDVKDACWSSIPCDDVPARARGRQSLAVRTQNKSKGMGPIIF